MSLHASERYDALGVALRALLCNWRDELLVLVQEGRAAFRKRAQSPLLLRFLDDGSVTVEQAGVAEHAFVTAHDDQRARTLARILLTDNAAGKMCDVEIVLPSAQLLRRLVRLPFMPRRALPGALRFELDRLSPLPPDQLYFDFRLVARDRKANKSELDLRVIKRDVVREAVALCHAAGAQVSAIGFEDDAHKADWRQFPIDRPAFLRSLWQRSNLIVLSGLAAFLFLAFLASLYANGAAANADLADQIDAARLGASRVEQVQHQIRDARAQIEFPEQQKRDPLLVAILAETSNALPDGTWLSELSVNERKVRIQGISHAASDLIGRLGHSFSNAEFTAPVVQNPQDRLDRFDISFDLGKAVR